MRDKDKAQLVREELSVEPKQCYRHYKGGIYYVLEVAVKEDTLEPLIIYRSKEKEYVWARTYENFCESVQVDGKIVKRFTLLDKQPAEQ